MGLAAYLSVTMLSVLALQGPVESKLPPRGSENDSFVASLESGLEIAQNTTTTKFQKLAEADDLYLLGQIDAAEKIYRQVKTPFSKITDSLIPTPISDPSQLGPAGRVYWREAQAGWNQDRKLETRIFVPLKMLVEKHPEFIPGQVLLVQALQEYDRNEEALEVLDRVTTLYPDQADLVKAKIEALEEEDQWLEASIAARQFALLYFDHERASEFAKIAEKDLRKYRRRMKNKLLGMGIFQVGIGVAEQAITGNNSGGISALQLTRLLLQGESKFGQQFAEAIKQEYKQKGVLVEEDPIVDYVNGIGQKVASLMGRDEFDYEFYVFADKSINAFALPGGKVFLSIGSILNTGSEAELAGMLSYQVSQAVLSQGYQRMAQATLLSNLNRVVPYGNIFTELLVKAYSREQVRQADTLGTRVIANAGYAADGLRNLLVHFHELSDKKVAPTWLSTHPSDADRVRDLENLIGRHNYNRYAYEGVKKHAAIQNPAKKKVGLS